MQCLSCSVGGTCRAHWVYAAAFQVFLCSATADSKQQQASQQQQQQLLAPHSNEHSCVRACRTSQQVENRQWQ
jgi:hypothetical protein